MVIYLKYENVKQAVFLSRPNRFIANIIVDGREEVCHVKNTSRCKELLYPGAEIYVQEFDSKSRKTKYDLISVAKKDYIVNIDSQMPNKVFAQWLDKTKYFGETVIVKPECVYGKSRFDFYIETEDFRKIFVEIKGVTLEHDGVCAFPDAPTDRGVKHLNELINCIQNGFEAYVFFVVQLQKANLFVPNIKTHALFADTLKMASDAGVVVKVVNCKVEHDSIVIDDFIDLNLDGGGVFV